jgi:hypothetical protein
VGVHGDGVDGHQLAQALDRDAEEIAADVIGMVVGRQGAR